MSFSKLILGISVIFWPISLALSSASWLAPLHFLISPKLALVPLSFFSFRRNVPGIIISAFILVIFWPGFSGQTIFRTEHESQQELIRNIHLYPNIYLARIYQNKGQIILSKFTDNLTQTLDPNNYFFANHPRELRTNPNLAKFPYPTIVFFLIGLFSFMNRKTYFVYLFSFSAIINLSVLTSFYGHDIILWPAISYFIFQGISTFDKSKSVFKIPIYITVLFLSLNELVALL